MAFDASSILSSQLTPLMRDLDDRRFLFVTGKGGVGKSTLCGALALAQAARGKRVLITLCHTKERLSAILGTKPIGEEIQQVRENVWAINISPELALEEYGAMVLKVRALSRAVFDNKYTKTFFRAVPGLYEWAMLGKAWFHTTELLDNGKNRFDIVLFDAPATGHGVDMLRVPQIILDVVPPGVLRRDAEAAWAMFRDEKKSGVIVVTLPEDMPATESVELISKIRGELGLPVHRLVVNAVMHPLFSESERKALCSDPSLLGLDMPARTSGKPEAALVAGARRAIRERIQEHAIQKLTREVDVKMVYLPFLYDEASTREGTEKLAKLL